MAPDQRRPLKNANSPARPERAPGCGRDMPREQWQDDAWLPEPPDDAELIEQLEARRVSVVERCRGKPFTALAPDPLCMKAARRLRQLTGGRG